MTDPSQRLISHGWPAPVASGVAEMVSRYGIDGPGYDPRLPPIAALDWDDTCMHGDISHETLALIDAEDPAGRVEAYERACSEDLFAAYRELVHTLVAGRTPEEVRHLSQRALQRGIDNGHLRPRAAMAALVESLQASGWIVRVVTASPAPLVAPLAGQIGIPPDHVVGMRSAIEGGRFVARLVGIETIGEGKLAALRDHAGRDPHFAAGDSISDRALMAASRYALLRDRGDRVMREAAAAAGWWVIGQEDA